MYKFIILSLILFTNSTRFINLSPIHKSSFVIPSSESLMHKCHRGLSFPCHLQFVVPLSCLKMRLMHKCRHGLLFPPHLKMRLMIYKSTNICHTRKTFSLAYLSTYLARFVFPSSCTNPAQFFFPFSCTNLVPLTHTNAAQFFLPSSLQICFKSFYLMYKSGTVILSLLMYKSGAISRSLLMYKSDTVCPSTSCTNPDGLSFSSCTNTVQFLIPSSCTNPVRFFNLSLCTKAAQFVLRAATFFDLSSPLCCVDTRHRKRYDKTKRDMPFMSCCEGEDRQGEYTCRRRSLVV